MSKEKDFEALFTAHYLQLYHYAQRLVSDSEVCRDIVEDAFEQFWKKMDHLAAEHWQGYIFMLVRNKCVDHTRHSVASTHYALFVKQNYHESFHHEDWDVIAQTEQYINIVNRLMGHLPEKTQFIIKECFYNNRTYVDVAKELGITPTAVRKHVVQALKRFKVELLKKSE